MSIYKPEILLNYFTYFPSFDELSNLFKDSNNVINLTIYQKTRYSGIRFYFNSINDLKQNGIINKYGNSPNLENILEFENQSNINLFIRMSAKDFRICFSKIQELDFCYEKERASGYKVIGIKELTIPKILLINALYQFNKIRHKAEHIACINILENKKMIKEYEAKKFGNKTPTATDLEQLACEIANGNRTIGKQYLKIALDSTMCHKQCNESEAFEKRWFNLLHELGHIYINCNDIDFYKGSTSNISIPSVINTLPGKNSPKLIDEYEVRAWCLIVIKIRGWKNPLDSFDVHRQQQWKMPKGNYYRDTDYFSSYVEWNEGYFLHPLLKLRLLGIDINEQNYLRISYENLNIIDAFNYTYNSDNMVCA